MAWCQALRYSELSKNSCYILTLCGHLESSARHAKVSEESVFIVKQRRSFTRRWSSDIDVLGASRPRSSRVMSTDCYTRPSSTVASPNAVCRGQSGSPRSLFHSLADFFHGPSGGLHGAGVVFSERSQLSATQQRHRTAIVVCDKHITQTHFRSAAQLSQEQTTFAKLIQLKFFYILCRDVLRIGP